MVILERKAPFYWLIERGGDILFGKIREEVGRWSFFIYVQNYAGGWLKFHFMVHALPGGLII